MSTDDKPSKKRKYREAFSETPGAFSSLEGQGNVVDVGDSGHFLTLLEERGQKVTVLMGYSPGVEACRQMHGYVNHLASKFPDVIFIMGDMTKLEDIAETQKMDLMPSFIIYKDNKPQEKIEGAFPEKLKSSLCKVTERDPKELEDETIPKGSEDLIHYINMKKSECRNSSDDTPFEEFVSRKGPLESDCDEQLLISYGFNQDIVLHGFQIKGPESEGPSKIKIFVNQLTSMDFDDAESVICAQEIGMDKNELKGETFMKLDRTKFNKVTNVTFFIYGNQDGKDVTRIDRLTLIGEAVDKKKGVAGHTTTIITL